MTRTVALGVAAFAVLALAGCGSGGEPASPTSSSAAGSTVTGSITVFAAASLTGAFTQIGKDFQAANPGTTVTFNFSASSTLATQITQGAPADVFASAAPANMATVVAAGDAADPVNFVSNTAEIAVPPSNPGAVDSLDDLARSGVTVAVCQPQVPCGAVAASVFAKAGITVNPVTQEADVKSTLAKVTTGAVDAGVVYVTDVLAAGSAVTGVTIPAAQNGSTEYPIATVTGSRNPGLAAAFVAYVRSAAGQQVLGAAGFAAP